MNILILNWRDPKNPLAGGAEAVTLEHAKGWTEKGHHVVWFTSMYKSGKSEEKIDGVKIVRQGSSFTVFLLAPLYILRNQRNFDVIIDEIHGIPFFSPLFTKKPVIVFIHEIAGVIWDYMFPFPINIIGKFFEKFYFKAYKNCKFWTDAPSTIDELVKKGLRKDQCVAIPCPISVQDKDVIARSRKIKKSGKPTFLFVSRIVKMKGIEEVIKAFSFISHDLTDAQLRIIGNGEKSYIQKLKKMIEEYGVRNKVIFVGYVSEEIKFKEMAQAHILLHASVKEGWGLVVLEAASVGTPSVVYNVTGLKDVVLNGKTGIVVSSNSPRDMAIESIHLYKDTNKYKKYCKECFFWVMGLNWTDASSQSINLIKKVYAKQSS